MKIIKKYFDAINVFYTTYSLFTSILLIIVATLFILGVTFGFLFLKAWIFMLLWNWVAVNLFNAPALNIWLALGLSLLSSLIFSSKEN